MTQDREGGRHGAIEHGRLSFLQLPTRDATRSAQFYSILFGWRSDAAGSRFEAPGLFGQWVDDRRAAPDAGPLLWMNVERIDEALTQAAAHGGEVIDAPSLDDGVRWLATVRDPGGNTIGLVQHGPR